MTKFHPHKSLLVFALAAFGASAIAFSSPKKDREYLIKFKDAESAIGFRAHAIESDLVRPDLVLTELSEEELEVMRGQPEVLVVERNMALKTLETPNDLKAEQWNLRNTKAAFDLNVIPAWRLTKGSKQVIVAVIDTGIDLEHPDLKANLWVNSAEMKGKPGVDDDRNGFVDDIHGYDFALKSGRPQDERGHGTHVSGIIGAVGNNSLGLVGVNWNVSIMALKMFPRYSEATVADAIRAIDYAVANGAKVINGSWGQSSGESDPDYVLLKEAIARAERADVTFIAAAGNNAQDNDRIQMIPATFGLANIVAVGSMDDRGQRASSSNFGVKSVDVFAPGSNVLSTVPGGSGYKSGTSMAAPHVAGVAALMLALNPGLKPTEIKRILVDSSAANQALSRYTRSGGHVDAGKAVDSVGGTRFSR
jgi:subtilisin family serine protease